jgi:Mrp family chromosome partitioning ATPase
VDLRVIGPGTNGASPAARFEYDVRRKLIADLRSQARFVIVEAPLTSGESRSPVLTLGEFADAAIIVVESSTLKRQDVDGLLRHLERIRVPVMGSVVIPRLDYAAGLQSVLGRQAAKPKLGKLAIRA